MKKSWWRRSFSPWPSCGHRLFHNQSTFYLGAPANDQEEKKKKKAKNYNKYEYNFFYKHFMKSLTLIACDRSSKVKLFFFLIIINIISVYSTKYSSFHF